MAICVNCGATKNLIRHHIVPIALGGTNNSGNIVILCENCHKIVHGKTSNLSIAYLGRNTRKPNAKVGRPCFIPTEAQKQIAKRWYNQEITAVEAMKLTGIPRATFYRVFPVNQHVI